MNVVHQIEKLKEWQHEMDEAWRELEKLVSKIENRVERLFDLFTTMNDALSKLEVSAK